MRRKNKFSISVFLISALGLLIFCKVFIKVLENLVFKSLGGSSLTIDDSDVNMGLVIVIVLLLMRGLYVYWKFKIREVTAAKEKAVGNDHSSNDSDQCAKCGKTVSEKVRFYCLNHPEKFKGKVYCYDHQFR